MEPILADLISRSRAHRRRLVVAAGAVLGGAALVVAVAVSAASAGGSTVRVAVAPTRAEPSASPTPSSVLVQVTGAVRRPGLVSVPAGSRAVDAITAAGGATATADESQVNLAARVVDGQQLAVPVKGAPPPTDVGTAASPATAVVSLSIATEAQLETLPRIGPAMAARIIAWRTAHGPFQAVTDLLKVGGIGPKTLAGLDGLVTP